MSRYDARYLARGWLSVAIAAAKDKDRPQLNRTMSIERFPRGIRLAATDSYVLLTSWVPEIEYPDEPEPDLDDAPVATAVAMDPHGRAKGFLAHLLSLASGEDAELIEVELGLGVFSNEDDDPTLGGMEARWVIIDYPDHERLKLSVYEGEFPNWRKAVFGFEAVSTPAMALDPEIIGRLAKLGQVNGGKPIVWHFGGVGCSARVEVGNAEPAVEGLVMPVRWDFDLDRPAEDAAAGANDTASAEADESIGSGPEPDDQPLDDDALVDEAVRLVVESQMGTEAMLMRELRIGFSKAEWVLNRLEQEGVVGPASGFEPREVLMAAEELGALDQLKCIDAVSEVVSEVADASPFSIGGIYKQSART